MATVPGAEPNGVVGCNGTNLVPVRYAVSVPITPVTV
jgi:hypothetical protein